MTRQQSIPVPISPEMAEVLLMGLDALDQDDDFAFNPNREADRKRADRARRRIREYVGRQLESVVARRHSTRYRNGRAA